MTTVPLGAALVELETGGEGGAWVRIRRVDGKDGWTPSRLTRRFSADTKWTVAESLIKERLARRGDSFPARAELVDFVDRLRGEAADAETSGRLAMFWLHTMSNVLEMIPMRQARSHPYAGWLDARRRLVVYNEPGGRWILRRDAILELHARERATASADDIAWFAASHGLPGECEGFVPCNLRRTDDLLGEYLRRHSAGRRANEAVAQVAGLAGEWTNPQGGFFFDKSRDCAELDGALTPLRAAVASTRAEQRSVALDELDKLKARCSR